MGSCKKKPGHLRSKASPRKNLEQHNASREHLQWPQQWPCFMVYAGGQALSFYRPWLLPTRMCHPPKPAFVTPCAILWCMQGVNTCHFIDPGFCQPACVAPKTRICHPLCHFMVYAGGQHLSFYRPWLLPTRMCRPQNPHLSPFVPFCRSCRESDPRFRQSKHAFEAIHVACLVAQFIYVHMKPAGVSHGLMQKEARAPQKQSKPEEKLRAA